MHYATTEDSIKAERLSKGGKIKSGFTSLTKSGMIRRFRHHDSPYCFFRPPPFRRNACHLQHSKANCETPPPPSVHLEQEERSTGDLANERLSLLSANRHYHRRAFTNGGVIWSFVLFCKRLEIHIDRIDKSMCTHMCVHIRADRCSTCSIALLCA